MDFRNHVQPVLAKAGCNAGACHGAAAGQNGFKLSLRGYDDDGDFLALTRQAWAGALSPGDPGRSLLLLKPTGAVPAQRRQTVRHQFAGIPNSVRMDRRGHAGPKRNDDPRIARIEAANPGNPSSSPASQQQLTVRAHFSDGHSEDVTRWAKFTDANAAVTQVDDLGMVKVVGLRRRGDHGLVPEQDRDRDRDRSRTTNTFRRTRFAKPSGATSSTSWCWRSCRA